VTAHGMFRTNRVLSKTAGVVVKALRAMEENIFMNANETGKKKKISPTRIDFIWGRAKVLPAFNTCKLSAELVSNNGYQRYRDLLFFKGIM
jgi:hypothetical protein